MWRRSLLLIALIPACGDDQPDQPDAGPSIVDLLEAVPGIESVTPLSTDHQGYDRFDLRFRQPVDHADPGGATFVQQMTLLHRDAGAPMILTSTGYHNYYGDYTNELTDLVSANQLVVEHRYFASSRPDPADWSYLTIEQAAGDHHAIVEALRPLYGAAWISTGGSKGGMTSVYHRRFWPDDVAGTVPYVAPISFGAPDYAYDAFVDNLGTPACRTALQELQIELLDNRRAMLEASAGAQADADGHSYTRVALAPAVESSVASLYWAFWQYYGALWCGSIPAPTAGDQELWEFLDFIAPVSDSSDDSLDTFDAYYFQADVELGYPGTMDTWLDGHLAFGADDYTGFTPVGVTEPPFRPEAMQDIDAWVQAEGAQLLFVYGEWDPWTGGAFELGGATDSALLTVARGTHGAGISDLAPADQEIALAKLEAWTGVEPDVTVLLAAKPRAVAPRMSFRRILRRSLP